jgi:AbrB family looped-hinge helix DNA binding protein
MGEAVHTVQMGHAGRVVIPADLRRRAGLVPGMEIEVRLDGEGRIVLEDRAARLRSLHGMFAHLRQPGESVVDELVARRRAEAAREEADGPGGGSDPSPQDR